MKRIVATTLIIAVLAAAVISIILIGKPEATKEDDNLYAITTTNEQEVTETKTETTAKIEDTAATETEVEATTSEPSTVTEEDPKPVLLMRQNEEEDITTSEETEEPEEIVRNVIADEPRDPVIYTAQYRAYVPDGYSKVIVSCGPLGLINAAIERGETRFAIIEILNFVHNFDEIAVFEDETLGDHCDTILTGISEGATGVWNLASDSHISAIAPISGTPNTLISERLTQIPVLALMRDSDHITVRAAMQDTIRELADRGNDRADYIVESTFFNSQFFDWAANT